MQGKTEQELLVLLTKANEGDKWALAQLISLFENTQPAAISSRAQSVALLEAAGSAGSMLPALRQACIIGVTGTPGAGKSSLIAAVTDNLLSLNATLRIAVLAIDPSSQISGGALLGDRTRMGSARQNARLFFRSQASALDLGGVGKQTFHVTRLLRRFFDIVLIETVGIGQSETDVRGLCDHSYLVLQPLAGDQVQFMKAGIMEVPDTFVINKCDEESLAKRSYHLLKSSLSLSPTEKGHDIQREILLTSATEGRGIAELAKHMLAVKENLKDVDQKRREQEAEQLLKVVRDEYGRIGEAILQDALAQGRLNKTLGFEAALRSIRPLLAEKLSADLTPPHN